MSRTVHFIVFLSLGVLFLACASSGQPEPAAAGQEVIVQALDLETARSLVIEVGGSVTHELGVINAVGARLTPGQREELVGRPGLRRIYAGRTVAIDTADSSRHRPAETGESGA